MFAILCAKTLEVSKASQSCKQLCEALTGSCQRSVYALTGTHPRRWGENKGGSGGETGIFDAETAVSGQNRPYFGVFNPLLGQVRKRKESFPLEALLFAVNRPSVHRPNVLPRILFDSRPGVRGQASVSPVSPRVPVLPQSGRSILGPT